MGAALIEQASDLRHLVASLLQLHDKAGVLSITVGIEPGAASGRTPEAEIVLKNELVRLRREGAHILERRLEAASSRLEDLLDASTTGRGRALYMALDSGAETELALEMDLPTRVRVGPAAHVLPLLAALDDGERSGLLGASRDSISVGELELGRLHRLDPMDLEPWIGDWWPEMKGPARANPQRGLHTVSQRDGYERRLAAAYRHALDSAVGAIGSLAHERGWSRAALAGDPRRIRFLDDALRGRGLATTTIDANLEGLHPADALRRLKDALGSLVAWRRARLAQEVIAAQKGACGLVPVLAALAEGRIDHLVIDAKRAFPGVVRAGERLAAAEPGEDTIDLTDLIVARALAMRAAVTPLTGDTAAALA
ncbi:MAG: hypothetical protein ACRDNP_14690, partial [Gaiellaceae bacterium]